MKNLIFLSLNHQELIQSKMYENISKLEELLQSEIIECKAAAIELVLSLKLGKELYHIIQEETVGGNSKQKADYRKFFQ
jgi:hypothetical protein